MITSLLLLLAFLATATLLAMSYRRIPEGQVYTLRRGKQATPRLLTAGAHWIVPWRDRLSHKISLTGRSFELQASAQDAHARIEGKIYWQVLDPARADAVIDHAEAWIREQALNGLRTQAALGSQLKAQLNQTLREQGILVTRMDLRPAA